MYARLLSGQGQVGSVPSIDRAISASPLMSLFAPPAYEDVYSGTFATSPPAAASAFAYWRMWTYAQSAAWRLDVAPPSPDVAYQSPPTPPAPRPSVAGSLNGSTPARTSAP